MHASSLLLLFLLLLPPPAAGGCDGPLRRTRLGHSGRGKASHELGLGRDAKMLLLAPQLARRWRALKGDRWCFGDESSFEESRNAPRTLRRERWHDARDASMCGLRDDRVDVSQRVGKLLDGRVEHGRVRQQRLGRRWRQCSCCVYAPLLLSWRTRRSGRPMSIASFESLSVDLAFAFVAVFALVSRPFCLWRRQKVRWRCCCRRIDALEVRPTRVCAACALGNKRECMLLPSTSLRLHGGTSRSVRVFGCCSRRQVAAASAACGRTSRRRRRCCCVLCGLLLEVAQAPLFALRL